MDLEKKFGKAIGKKKIFKEKHTETAKRKIQSQEKGTKREKEG